MKIKYGKKEINILAKRVSEIGKIFGLMFRGRNSKNLLFSFRKKTRIGIHSFFVFFPFLALWIDDDNNVIEFRIVKPFTSRIAPKKPFAKLIEIPFNGKNRKILDFFVDKKDLNIPDI